MAAICCFLKSRDALFKNDTASSLDNLKNQWDFLSDSWKGGVDELEGAAQKCLKPDQ